ncbi:hypothetical protein HOD19_01580 [bacterium]|nr:hypothetical protein [bacterium]
MKKAFIITLLITFGLFITQVAYAGSNKPICFTPMIAIPGFDNTGCSAGQIAISSKGGAIALYINALYDYAAGAAGVVAMFMIVFAAWQWIIAAGNASKIDTAKDTIRGALLGLAFLFTGHLLLSNISSGLVDFNSLDLTGIGTKQEAFGNTSCSSLSAEKCPDRWDCQIQPGVLGDDTCIERAMCPLSDVSRIDYMLSENSNRLTCCKNALGTRWAIGLLGGALNSCDSLPGTACVGLTQKPTEDCYDFVCDMYDGIGNDKRLKCEELSFCEWDNFPMPLNCRSKN